MKGYFSVVDEFDEDEKKKVILVVGECGYDIEWVFGYIGGVEVDIYYVFSMCELVE